MIPSQFYLPTNYITPNNSLGISPNFNEISETGDFSNAYWTGWIKKENAPKSWSIFKFNRIDGDFVFEEIVSENSNFNLGYLFTESGYSTTYIPTYIQKETFWNCKGRLSNSTTYFPNKYDFRCTGFLYYIELSTIRVRINQAATLSYYSGAVSISYKDFLNPDYEFTLDGRTFKMSDFEKGYVIIDNFLYFIAQYACVSDHGYFYEYNETPYFLSNPRLIPMIEIDSSEEKIICCGYSSQAQSGYVFDCYIPSSDSYGQGILDASALKIRDNLYLGSLNVRVSKNDLDTDFEALGYLLYDESYIVCYPTNTYNYFAITKIKKPVDIIKHFNLNRIVTVRNTQDFYKDEIIFYPEIIDNEYTGNAITGDDLSDKLPDWIKEGDNTLNEYTEDDKPSPEPEPEPDLPEETGDRILNQFSRTIGVSSNFITTYIMNDAQISELGKILWTSWTDDTVTMDMVQNFYGLLQETTGSWDISSVMNFIVNCKIFPFSLPTLLTTTPTRNLYIGTGKFAIQCSTGVDFFIASSPTAVLNAGSVTVPRLYNDFRDYENTNITVYLPFCGNLELNPADVVGKQISCTYVIDLFSGACTAYLYTSDDVGILYNVAIQKGKCGFSVPITATNAGQISTMLTVDGLKDSQGIAGMLGTAVNTGLGVLNTGSASGLLGGANSFISQGFGLEIMQQERMGRSGISCRSLSGGSNFGDFMCPSTAYIQIRRAMYSLPAQYDSTVGYTTHAKRYGRVSNFNGFIQCVNADVSGLSITEEEKNEIKSLLESGIYVN